MNKTEIITKLKVFRDRLNNEVLQAFVKRGSSFGKQRFASWRKQFTKFLDLSLPGESDNINSKLNHTGFVVIRGESIDKRFWREDGSVAEAFIDSLIIDIENDEYDFEFNPTPLAIRQDTQSRPISNKVFIVHGHNDLKIDMARFIEKLGYEAIILDEQASGGQTIIEKIESYTDVGFAIVLYTPDDMGNVKAEAKGGNLNQRARQNVVFEHGYLIARLGRARVATLVSDTIELPSDISGVVYLTSSNWQIKIAQEMKSNGYQIDLNKLVEDSSTVRRL